jgi:hypothetical protein
MTDVWAAFLTARLDELAEIDWHVFDCNGMPWEDGHCCEASRWLTRDVAAKRAILAYHAEVQSWSYPPGDGDEAVQDALGVVVRDLAAAWSGHADYPGHQDHSDV